eukprot:scaffold630_cov174-Amphora_coffeaeformis.AAC.12
MSDKSSKSAQETTVASTTRDQDEGTAAPNVSRAMLQETMVKRTIMSASLVLLIGSITSAGFMYIGITNSRSDHRDQFDRRASELVSGIENSWNDYETAGLWIHEACRNRDATREEFRAVYEYLSSGGLDFQAAEWIPRVTREERDQYEQDSLRFYEQHYPEVLPYLGFRGLEPDPENPGTSIMQARSDQPFYYPVSYVEPVLPNAAAIDFDLYSSASRRATIEAAITSFKPNLTRRLRLVQETDPSAYSVLLMHPGIPLESEGVNAVAADLSLMVIRIPSLLERSVRDMKEDRLAVYLYDFTEAETEQDAQFLGAIRVISTADEIVVSSIDERDYPSFVHSHNGRNEFVYQETLEIASSKWVVTVVPVTNEYEADIVFVILGGCMLFLATICLAIWMIHNVRRSINMQRVLERAEVEKQIVSSLFPSNVRDRLIEDAVDNQGGLRRKTSPNIPANELVPGSKPIADLFTDVSIMFADMQGFTAWSSARDPAQVFTLLESVYSAFDKISISLGVFKVETVGDCYVACAGLPQPREDHALVMAEFATCCLKEMTKVAHDLEPILGPDTSEIQLRIGLHSGPTTAGVLRGLKGRFQLFGDSMNLASRMEATGVAGQIHVSQEYAEEIQRQGKGEWLTLRKDAPFVKGKGVLTTYFLKIESNSTSHVQASSVPQSFSVTEKNVTRLVDWNVQVLSDFLKKIVARRMALKKQPQHYLPNLEKVEGAIPFDEVVDTLALSPYTVPEVEVDLESIELDQKVLQELREFVMVLAGSYRQGNPFHNFDHASHVCMSVVKLLRRIVSVDPNNSSESIHRQTFGITSDPLAQFACVFSALCHDVDHPGVPNSCLNAENAVIARAFKHQSAAEQNSSHVYSLPAPFAYSIELAWQLLVNVVMATDNSSHPLTHYRDKTLNSVRRQRWENAFAEDQIGSKADNSDKRATIVLEHLMQASDVAHTMQHWHVYLKWNERLFNEMYAAYEADRLDKDPSASWYEGEIGFLDYYVIPLANKLDACGVFGVSSREYLNYAESNRKEWAARGKVIVAEYLQRYKERNTHK